MWSKYANQHGNAEAEWVHEVLDMHDGDERRAFSAVEMSLAHVIAWRRKHPTATMYPERGHLEFEVTEFERNVEAATWATGGRWWADGLRRLREIQMAEST